MHLFIIIICYGFVETIFKMKQNAFGTDYSDILIFIFAFIIGTKIRLTIIIEKEHVIIDVSRLVYYFSYMYVQNTLPVSFSSKESNL